MEIFGNIVETLFFLTFIIWMGGCLFATEIKIGLRLNCRKSFAYACVFVSFLLMSILTGFVYALSWIWM